MKNKRILNLTLLLAVIVVLVVVYFIVIKNESGDSADTTVPKATTYTVAKIDLNTVYQFSYTYEGTKYSFRLNEAEDGWLWDGDPDLPISNTKVALMLTYFSEMTATVALENVTEEKMAEYGLTDPALELSFKDSKGEHSFKVGIVNPYNSLAYVSSSVNNTIAYMVESSFIDEYSCSVDDMLQIEENPIFSLKDDITVTFDGKDKLIYKFYPTGKTDNISNNCKWFLSINGVEEFPINEELGAELSSALKAALFAEVITYDTAKYADYGLKEKEIKVVIDGTGVTSTTDQSTGETVEIKTPASFSFYMGTTDEDGFSYAITDNSPLLYLTTSSVFDSLYTFDKNNLSSVRSAYVWNADPSDVSEFSLIYNGNTYVFAISETSSSITCTMNGKPISYDSATPLIKAISMLGWDNDISKASEDSGNKDEVLSLSIKVGEISASASFVGYSKEYYRIKYGDRSEFLILKSNLDAIIDLLSELIK